MRPKALLSWSSGKDCAWALHVLRRQAEVEVVGLATTVNRAFDRVAMHGVRRELVEAQARAAGLPLWTVPLPWSCTNEVYEARMREACDRATVEGITQIAFGDLFLEDVRGYRERLFAGSGLTPIFPLWGTPADTPVLARAMIDAGLRAVLTCLDPTRLPAVLAGRRFDETLLQDLPDGVDPCGERGEFHTFCHAGPMFSRPIPVRVGETVTRDGFVFTDVLPLGDGG